MSSGFRLQLVILGWFFLAVVQGGGAGRGDEVPDDAKVAELSGIASWPVGRVITGADEQETRIYAALVRPFMHAFDDASLDDVARSLEKQLSCTVLLDRAALAADGLDGVKVSFRAQGRSLRNELRAILEPRRLKAIVCDDSLTITTPAAAQTHLLLRVYQVHDLVVKLDDVTARRPDFDRLITLVVSHTGSEDWNNYGGEGDIRSFEGPGILAIVVRQTEETHAKVEQLLAQLRAARLEKLLEPVESAPIAEPDESENDCLQIGSGALVEPPSVPPPPPFPRGKVIYPLQTATEKSIYRVLQQPAVFEFQALRLDEFANLVSERYKITVELDTPALIADGKGAETKLAFRWHDGSLRNALRRLLDGQGLAFVVQDDALRLTTKTAAETIEVTYLYQVNDLLAHDMRRIGRSAEFDVFHELISALVAPETWREGTGMHIEIFGFEAPGVQVVAINQTHQVHEEIERLLSMLRAAYEPKVYEAQRGRPVVRPPEPVPSVPGRGMF